MMRFGKPSLSRVACVRCREETIHRYGKCIHCGTKLHEKAVFHPSWRATQRDMMHGPGVT